MKLPKITRAPMNLSRWMELLLDSLCCIAMAIGVLWAIQIVFPPYMYANVDTLTLLWQTAVVVTVLALGTRITWVLPAVIGGALVLGALFITFTGSWDAFIKYITQFADWWLSDFPKGKFSTSLNVSIVNWIVLSAVVSFIYLCVRGFKQVWVMIICAGVLFWVITVNGYQRNSTMAMIWLCAGLFPLFARYASASMPWLKGQSKEKQRESRKKWRKPAWYIYATAVVFVAICVAITTIAAPSKEQARQWIYRPFADAAEDFQSVIGIDNQMDTGFVDLDMSALGLQPQEDKLGGNIDLRDKTNVLKVRTETPALLRGKVYTTYNGSSWTVDESKFYRLGSTFLFEEEYYQAFGLDKPESEEGQRLLQEMGPNVQMTVTLLQPNSSLLYTSGRLFGFDETINPANIPVLYNMNSEVFFNGEPQTSGYQYTFTGQFFARWDPIFKRNVEALLEEALANPDMLWNSAEFKKLYLDVPANTPDIVGDLAMEVTKDKQSNYEMMVALESYLKENYRYNEEPGETPEGEDFVGYFLETGSGYCVHFASAMAMMARSVGVPSRLVVGYGLEQDQKGDLWYARRKNAHAWTECYFEGLGWVAFDPTSLYDELTADVPEPPTSTTVSTVTKFNNSDAKMTVTSAVVDESGEGVSPWYTYLALMSMVVLVLMAAAVLLLRRLRYTEIAYLPENVSKRFAGLGEQADYYYTDIIRQLKLLHYAPKNRETMKQFAARVEQGSGLEADAMRQVFDIMMRWRYGKMEPTEEELALVETMHEHLEKRVHDELNPVMYFVRRRLML